MALTKVTAGVIAANAVVDSFGSQSITGDKIGLTAINANNIVTGAVTGDKLGATSINANNIVNASITGDKIGVGQITANLFASGAVSTTSISNGNSNVSIASANSDVSIFTAGNAAASFDSNQVFKFNSGYGSVATAYGCRAWVNFDGTGTVAIRASGNVSSITDNGTGDYTINFTTAMPDANYTTFASSRTDFISGGAADVGYLCREQPTTSATRILTGRVNDKYDQVEVNVVIFR
jgi:hypothetical protein